MVVAGLEAIAARLAAQRHTKSQLEEMKDANENCRQAKSVEGFNEANMVFHEAVISSSQNKLLQDQLRSARPMTFPYRHHLTNIKGYMAKSVIEHDQIIEAIASGEGELAQREMCAHVNLQGEGTIGLLRLLEEV